MVLRWYTSLHAARKGEINQGLIDAALRGELTKRPWRHREHLFTFLDYPYVPHDNNFADRLIRPAVILRNVLLQSESGERCRLGYTYVGVSNGGLFNAETETEFQWG